MRPTRLFKIVLFCTRGLKWRRGEAEMTWGEWITSHKDSHLCTRIYWKQNFGTFLRKTSLCFPTYISHTSRQYYKICTYTSRGEWRKCHGECKVFCFCRDSGFTSTFWWLPIMNIFLVDTNMNIKYLIAMWPFCLQKME